MRHCAKRFPAILLNQNLIKLYNILVIIHIILINSNYIYFVLTLLEQVNANSQFLHIIENKPELILRLKKNNMGPMHTTKYIINIEM